SSRRRHTRSDRDWSSDVCSSDLLYMLERHWSELCLLGLEEFFVGGFKQMNRFFQFILDLLGKIAIFADLAEHIAFLIFEKFDIRSEERRVGKEGGVGVVRV